MGAYQEHGVTGSRDHGISPGAGLIPMSRALVLSCSLFWEANKPSSVFKTQSSTAPRRRIIYLGPRLLDVSSSLPGTLVALAYTARAAPRPLFGLAPSGVYPAAAVASLRGGLLHHHFTLACAPIRGSEPSAVYSLWHFPSPHDARPLAGTLPSGARTFLEPCP